MLMISAYGFSDVLGTKNVVLDPSRIAAQVISGIGFIGAGTILFLKQGIIRGMTKKAQKEYIYIYILLTLLQPERM